MTKEEMYRLNKEIAYDIWLWEMGYYKPDPYEKIKIICKKYEDLLLKNIEANEENDNQGSIAHIKWMLQQIPIQLENNKIEKAMRWLGFVQGVLWCKNIRSIQEMRDDNSQKHGKS